MVDLTTYIAVFYNSDQIALHEGQFLKPQNQETTNDLISQLVRHVHFVLLPRNRV